MTLGAKIKFKVYHESSFVSLQTVPKYCQFSVYQFYLALQELTFLL
jgi:hypothetical protein